jgi:hypothetical protein
MSLVTTLQVKCHAIRKKAEGDNKYKSINEMVVTYFKELARPSVAYENAERSQNFDEPQNSSKIQKEN